MSRSIASVGFSPILWKGARKIPNFMPLCAIPAFYCRPLPSPTRERKLSAAAMRDRPFTPAVALVKLYRARRVSPREVMDAVLARIDAINPRVNAVVTLARDAALWEARRATAALKRGAPLPPLFGLPVAIKDVTATKGIRTTQGSKLFENHVPEADALVVQRVRAAGGIVIGKT